MALKFANEYDLVVVGAGPAGSVTSRFASENGASVLMLERDREPGIPVRCAEGISSGGLETFIDLDKKWIASEISNAKLITPDGSSLMMKSSFKGYILERRLFDAALCDLACQKGAVMLTRANVMSAERTADGMIEVAFTHLGEMNKVKCRILIGADGIESRVGRWLGLKTHLQLSDVSSALQYTLNNIDIDSETLEFHFGTKIAPGGYIWVFPKSSTTANVGIGVAGSFTSEKKSRAYLDEFINQRFKKPSISYTVFAGIPICATLKEIVADNLMLVGDAARQVNPITGGGIKQAMIAGKIAGLTAAEGIKKGDYSAKFLNQYPQSWEKVLGSKHRFMYTIKEKILYASDERLNRIATMCNNIPPDKMNLTDLFKQVIKGDPKLVAEMAKAFVVSKFSI
jgi:digeranylgeranylglycerophospholipid reductase